MRTRFKHYRRYCAAVLAVTVIAVLLQGPYERPFFVFNTSPSIPLGLYYRRRGVDGARAGDVVLFAIPAGTAHRFVKHRLGEVRSNWTILKPVAAAGGDHVCTRDGWLFINGTRAAPLVETDSDGNPVPSWRGCRVLKDGELFVMATRVERSFDSRVYGPIREALVWGIYAPLWVSGGGSD
jgi:conjugative transfer signal peptidase TraF